MNIQEKMQLLPSIDTLLSRDVALELSARYSREIVKDKCTDILNESREQIKNNTFKENGRASPSICSFQLLFRTIGNKNWLAIRSFSVEWRRGGDSNP